jgi:1-deoxy-D-xylulose 5-phosphate reductoisomerase
VEAVLDGYAPATPAHIDDVLSIDAEARARAAEVITRTSKGIAH